MDSRRDAEAQRSDDGCRMSEKATPLFGAYSGFVLDKLREQARSQGVSTETFVNVLLQEHV